MLYSLFFLARFFGYRDTFADHTRFYRLRNL